MPIFGKWQENQEPRGNRRKDRDMWNSAQTVTQDQTPDPGVARQQCYPVHHYATLPINNLKSNQSETGVDKDLYLNNSC